jgi:zinc transporter ZupT
MGVIGFVCALIVIVFQKLLKFNFKPIISVLIAFAAGALMGDAFVHLIPDAFSTVEDGEDDEEV